MDFRTQLFQAQGKTTDLKAVISSLKALEDQDIFLDIATRGEQFQFEFDYRDFSEIVCVLMAHPSALDTQIFFQDDKTCGLKIQRP